jgi:N-methylhydantoinase A
VARYLERIHQELREIGARAALLIMLSSGGICTVETAARYPIRLVESGPAAGALAAAHFGRLTGRPSLLSFDMGGTTAKSCLIDNGQPTVATEFEVSRVYRFKKGSGLPVRVPSIELIEIGAGGGSIARVDSLGLLKVGPESAGAAPGPACYGLGGKEPTVTDADLVLGYLDPEFFLGGRMRLDVNAAREAIARLGQRLDLDVIATAWGIHQVVNEQMASAARIHAIEQGKDPRSYPIFAFGGAGPVHAYRVAEILHSPEVIIPLGAGVASTLGFLVAPLAFDFVRTYAGRLDELDWSEVAARYQEMEAEGLAMLRSAGVTTEAVTITRTAELRYAGQGHQVTVGVPLGPIGSDTRCQLEDRFEQEYRRLYGRTAPGNPIEAVNWRIVAAAPSPSVALTIGHRAAGDGRHGAAQKGERAIYLPEVRDFRPVPVYDRYALSPGMGFSGPAVIEERESTAVIGPGAWVEVDHLLNLVIRMPR